MKTVNLRRPSKHDIVKNILEESLCSGEYQLGEQFPSQNELAERFGVVPSTIREAVAALVQEGLLTRQQGKGTFVARTRERIQESHLTGLFIHTRGHLYGEFTRYLIRAVQSAGFHALTHDLSDLSPQELLEELEKVMAADMGAFIIDGVGRFPFDKVYGHDEKPVIFIHRLETPLPFPNAFKVLHDFEAGGYMVIKHLLDLGHKKILFYSHPIQPEPYFLIHSLLKGMYRAFEEKGLDGRKALVIKTDGWNWFCEKISASSRESFPVRTGRQRHLPMKTSQPKIFFLWPGHSICLFRMTWQLWVISIRPGVKCFLCL